MKEKKRLSRVEATSHDVFSERSYSKEKDSQTPKQFSRAREAPQSRFESRSESRSGRGGIVPTGDRYAPPEEEKDVFSHLTQALSSRRKSFLTSDDYSGDGQSIFDERAPRARASHDLFCSSDEGSNFFEFEEAKEKEDAPSSKLKSQHFTSFVAAEIKSKKNSYGSPTTMSFQAQASLGPRPLRADIQYDAPKPIASSLVVPHQQHAGKSLQQQGQPSFAMSPKSPPLVQTHMHRQLSSGQVKADANILGRGDSQDGQRARKTEESSDRPKPKPLAPPKPTQLPPTQPHIVSPNKAVKAQTLDQDTGPQANRAVLVKDLMHQTLTLFVDKHATVSELKLQIEKEILVPPEHCHIEFEGKKLSNPNATLKFYGLKKDSVVQMVLELEPSPLWEKWHKNLVANWTDFEMKHFSEGEYFMQQWTEMHNLIVQASFESKLKDISAEQRRNPYAPPPRKPITNASIKLLPKPVLSPLTPTGPGIYKKYLDVRRDQKASQMPFFYFDVADALFQATEQEKGLRVLTSLAELDFKNPQFLRLIAFKLVELGEKFHGLAIQILKQAKTLRPEEPQSFLLLAYAFVESANQLMIDQYNKTDASSALALRETAQQHYAQAIELINHVIMGKWDVRFAQVEVTALMELTRVANFVKEHGFDTTHRTLHSVDHRLLSPITVDLRVVIVWDTDMTDVELHVREPNGEKCYSFHNKTSSGGMLSKDFSHGYGPEEYIIRTASTGTYDVFVKLFSSLSKFTGTTISVRIWTHYGNPKKEQLKHYSVRLHKDKETYSVAKVHFSMSGNENQI